MDGLIFMLDTGFKLIKLLSLLFNLMIFKMRVKISMNILNLTHLNPLLPL